MEGNKSTAAILSACVILFKVPEQSVQVMRKRTVSKKFSKVVTSVAANNADTQCNLFHNATHQKGVQVSICDDCNPKVLSSGKQAAVQTTPVASRDRKVQTGNFIPTEDA